MHSQTMPRTIAAGAVIVAAGLALVARMPRDEPLPAVPSNAIEAAAPNDAPVVLAVAEPIAPSDDAVVAAKVRELEAMSESFRNTTFLIAIRDQGFVCFDLLRVYGGVDDSGKWAATCSEMLSYTISVADTGTLRVEPMLQYFDSPLPAVQTLESPPGPRQQQLRQRPQQLPQPNR
jgi:hypothetical protein